MKQTAGINIPGRQYSHHAGKREWVHRELTTLTSKAAFAVHTHHTAHTQPHITAHTHTRITYTRTTLIHTATHNNHAASMLCRGEGRMGFTC